MNKKLKVKIILNSNRNNCIIHECIGSKEQLEREVQYIIRALDKGDILCLGKDLNDKFNNLSFYKVDEISRVITSFENILPTKPLGAYPSAQNPSKAEQIPSVKEPSYFHVHLVRIADLLERKNADYGNSFSKTADKFGAASYLSRMDDKINRLNQLLDPSHVQQVKTESLHDTLDDIIGYATLIKKFHHERNADE